MRIPKDVGYVRPERRQSGYVNGVGRAFDLHVLNEARVEIYSVSYATNATITELLPLPMNAVDVVVPDFVLLNWITMTRPAA